MLMPSTFVVLTGVLLAAVAAALDWYVWGLNLASNPRQPHSVQPMTGLELLDLGLGRLIAFHRAILPKAAFASAHANNPPIATDPDDGFKRVA
jgi:hypothetical protein